MSGRVEAWSVASPKLRFLATKYKVPIEVLVNIKAKDEEQLKRIAEAYRVAHDTVYAQAALAAREAIMLFGKPEAVRIREGKMVKKTEEGIEEVKTVDVTIKFKTVAVTWRIPKPEFAKIASDIEKFVDRLTNWLLVKAVKHEYTSKQKKATIVWWEAKAVKFLSVDEDRETARRLIEVYGRRYEWPILAALAAVYGYHPDIIMEPEGFITLLSRFVIIVGGNVSTPTLHGIELTLPGTGKTTMANLSDVALKWLYFAEPPSPASLLGDARTGWSPLSGANGVWFDEFDAWFALRTRDDFKEAVTAILTGMEQGRWKRSKGGVKAPQVDRPIALYFTGNIDENGCIMFRYRGAEHRECFGNAREFAKWVIGQLLPSKRQAFNERIAVAVMNVSQKTPQVIQEWTLSRRSGKIVVGKPSVVRGLVSIIQEEIALQWDKIAAPKKEFDNMRLQQRFEAVSKVVAVLLGNIGEPLQDSVVYGYARNLVRGLVVR